MRYVPDIIAKQFRVLPERFKGTAARPSVKQKPLSRFLCYLGFSFVLLLALAYANHFPLFCTLALFAFILLPYGSRKIEKVFQFRLTPRLKSGAVLLFVFVSFPMLYHYGQIDNREQELIRIAAEKKKAEELAQEQKENARKASFRLAFAALDKAHSNKDFEQTDSLLGVLNAIARTGDEKSQVRNKGGMILASKAATLLEKKRFADALPLYGRIVANSPNNADALYNHALCLSKTGDIQAAVSDLKKGIEMGDEKASQLHDKINPIRRRIIGYTTLCCDGTTSSARGRGACSWHNGVCDWNHPVYQEYRKYE